MSRKALSREEWERKLTEWLEDEAKAKQYAALFDHHHITDIHTLIKVIEEEPRELKNIGITVGHRVVIYEQAKKAAQNDGRYRIYHGFGNLGFKLGGFRQEFFSRELYRAGLAEAVASGIYVFILVGIIVASGELPKYVTANGGQSYTLTTPDGSSSDLSRTFLPAMRYLSIAIGAGFAFSLTSYVFASVSGGHITPAISLAYAVTAEISPLRFLVYVANQLIGAMIGAGFIKTVSSHYFDTANAGFNFNQDGYTDSNSLGIEVLTTTILIMTALSLSESVRSKENRWFGHLQLGFVFLVAHLIALPINGSSMNPTRSFATAALTGRWAGQWPLWVGPGLGALIGAISYEVFVRERVAKPHTSIAVHHLSETKESS